VRHFVAGARGAYEAIVVAFAAGDRNTLRDLLSRDVFESFVGAIGEREKRGETVETTFVGIEKAEIRQVQQKFVQMFHFKHAAVKGMFRFMDDLQHYQTFNKESLVASEEASLHGFTDKAASDVSSEHFMETDSALFTQSGLHGSAPLVQEPK
jgi:hypothetical protein